MKFSDLGLRPELLKNLENLKFESCTPIQEAVIPLIVEGKDISGLAQTGTGKTAAFLLPLMDRVIWSQKLLDHDHRDGLSEAERLLGEKRQFLDWKRHQYILVLVPTRELAEQVYQDVYRLRGDSGLEAVSVYGGQSYDGQKSRINQGVEFVVGTPGRLIDLYKSHALDLKQVRAVVFDEADRMFDMGFREDMKFILQRVPKDRQFLVFSATLNFEVLHTAYQFGANPIEFNVSRDQAKTENVKDYILHVGTEDKPAHLLSILKKQNPRQVIIFTNFKYSVDRLAKFLNGNDYPAVAISSLLTQAQRNRVIEQFKAENEKNILVATDLAARGLDIKGVDLVINFEMPEDPENYVHRIGRTGRAGATGVAYSMVGDRDVESLMRVEEYLKHKIEVFWLEDGDIVKEFKIFSQEESRTSPRAVGSDSRQGRSGPKSRKGSSEADGRKTNGRDTRRGHKPMSSQPVGAAGTGDHQIHRDRRIGRHGEGVSDGKTPRKELPLKGTMSRRPIGRGNGNSSKKSEIGASPAKSASNRASRSSGSLPASPRAQNRSKSYRINPGQGGRKSRESGLISKVSSFLRKLIGD